MELISYLKILQRRKWIILATALVTIVVAVAGHALMPANYQTSAVIRIIPYSTNNPSYNEIMYADRVMKTYLEIGSSSVVMSAIRDDLGLPPDRDISVDVEIIPDTELLRITVKDHDPVLATDAANALVAYLVNDKTIRDVRVMLMEPAMPPKPPSVLSIVAFYVLAILGGTLGGVGLAFVLDNIDTHLNDDEQIKHITQLPVLCRLPMISGAQKSKRIADQPPYNQAFQCLSVVLVNNVQKKGLRTILVTSSEVGEGKSTVAANLAVSLAGAGYKTLLVDADIHEPVIHEYFGLENGKGICDFLSSEVAPKGIIQVTNRENLSVMTGGTKPEHFNGLINGIKQIKSLFERLSDQYDFLILDASAYLGLADGLILSSLTDGVLVVVRLGVTRILSLVTACQQLEYAHANVIGIVVNGAKDVYSKTTFYRESKHRNKFDFHLLKRILVVKNGRNEEQVQRAAVSHEEV